jgi:hypothetical protein
MENESEMSFRDIRDVLLAVGYKVPRRNYGNDSPIISSSGFPVGSLEKEIEGFHPSRVCVAYNVEADGLPAVMQLHLDCQNNDLPYQLSDASHRVDRLDGEINYRRNLIKGIKKLMRADGKLRR